MKAGIYVRISRDVAGEGLGVARQEEDCQALATRLGWEVVRVYPDNDVSATATKPRPQYDKMLADLEAGHINAILAWHPDRLYRRAVDLGGLVDVVKRTNARVATVNAGEVDLASPTGLLVAEMLAAIAMYEVRHKSERWSRSWQQGREAGKVAKTGSRMYGYTRDGKVIPEEAAFLRQIAADILAGVSMGRTLERAEREGLVGTRGGAWTNVSLKRLLTNPRLAGWSTLKGQIVGKGEWEPIFDEETHQSLIALLNSRTRTYVPRRSLLLGLVFCEACGHRLITGNSRGGGTRAYKCPNRPGLRGCGGISADARYTDAIVEGYARERLDNPEVRAAIGLLTAQSPTDTSELAGIEGRILELERQLDEPGVPVTTLMRAIERARARQAELVATLADDRALAVPLPRPGEWPEDDDLLRRRELIGLVVDHVNLKPVSEFPPTNRFINERVVIVPRELESAGDEVG